MRVLISLLALIVFASPCLAVDELSGRRAPGWALPDSNLKHHDLYDYRGKIVVIELMQTACPHCRTFAPVLEKIKQKFAGKVQVFSVVTYPPDTLKTVEEYIAEYKITYPVLYDCGQMSRSYLKVTMQDGQRPLPHVFVVDAEGMIAHDFGYSWDTKIVFEGDGLSVLLEKMLKSKAGKK